MRHVCKVERYKIVKNTLKKKLSHALQSYLAGQTNKMNGIKFIKIRFYMLLSEILQDPLFLVNGFSNGWNSSTCLPYLHSTPLTHVEVYALFQCEKQILLSNQNLTKTKANIPTENAATDTLSNMKVVTTVL